MHLCVWNCNLGCMLLGCITAYRNRCCFLHSGSMGTRILPAIPTWTTSFLQTTTACCCTSLPGTGLHTVSLHHHLGFLYSFLPRFCLFCLLGWHLLPAAAAAFPQVDFLPLGCSVPLILYLPLRPGTGPGSLLWDTISFWTPLPTLLPPWVLQDFSTLSCSAWVCLLPPACMSALPLFHHACTLCLFTP